VLYTLYVIYDTRPLSVRASRAGFASSILYATFLIGIYDAIILDVLWKILSLLRNICSQYTGHYLHGGIS
jgi:hypothetical protein